jgi:hypothetical protein
VRYVLGALAFALGLSPGLARAQGPAPPGLYADPDGEQTVDHDAWLEDNDRSEDSAPPEFQFISYFLARGSALNELADPSGLRGVSLGPIGIGQGVGSATRVGDESENFYIEQRWIPILAYSPHFADGIATLRSQFEIDFTWGLAANAIQNNQGGGFNADQINIQTKNINVALYPTRKPKQLSIIIGTQPVYDTFYDPTVTSLFDLVQTGYKLSFMGTDATGISAYLNTPYSIAKLSFIPIGAAQPDVALTGDARFSPVFLVTADYAYPVNPGTVLGLSYWHLRDETQGAAYAYEGIVNSGPGSPSLWAFTGTSPLPIEEAEGHVHYVGANLHHNLQFRTGDFAASGFVMANFGEFRSAKEDTLLHKRLEVRGVAANFEAMYNWGYTPQDRITLEGMYTSGDQDRSDGVYESAFTMNYYGLPGAVWFNHKTLILFPFTTTVSNYTGAVTDISNRGLGLAAAIGTASWDIVPNKLNAKIGGAYAQSMERGPEQNGIVPGRIIGAEVNAELKYHFRYLMTLGLHGGYMFRGDFYDGNDQVTTNPWATFLTFNWIAF